MRQIRCLFPFPVLSPPHLSSLAAGDELLVLGRVDDGAGARVVEEEGLDKGALLRHEGVP